MNKILNINNVMRCKFCTWRGAFCGGSMQISVLTGPSLVLLDVIGIMCNSRWRPNRCNPLASPSFLRE